VDDGGNDARFLIGPKIAAGGMATVHLALDRRELTDGSPQARALGAWPHTDGARSTFAGAVVAKRLRPEVAGDPRARAMFVDETRLASCIDAANVARVVDVIAGATPLLVLEYVHGESLAALVREARQRREEVPAPIAVRIAIDALRGLAAAHRAQNESGMPLGIVHRDVSPQNILVGANGVSKMIDFGVARAAERVASTRDGMVKGKLGYMAPEQLTSGDVDARTDVFALAIVLWELLTGERLLFREDTQAVVYDRLIRGGIPAPSALRAGVPRLLDAIVLHALELPPDRRFETADEMADALRSGAPRASRAEVASWVRERAGEGLAERERMYAELVASLAD
jgi:serine/threonine-protein kinase